MLLFFTWQYHFVKVSFSHHTEPASGPLGRKYVYQTVSQFKLLLFHQAKSEQKFKKGIKEMNMR